MSGRLIATVAGNGFEALAARLTARAAALAEARARSRALEARADESRWRRAGLLWPLFGDR